MDEFELTGDGHAWIPIPEYMLQWIEGKPVLQVDEMDALALAETLERIAAAIINPSPK